METRQPQQSSAALRGPGAVLAWIVLGAAAVGLWAVTIGQARSMGIGPGTMGMSFAFFGGMWVAMMGAMMLPSISPVAVRASAIGVRAPSAASRAVRATSHVAGFLVPWAGFGALAFAALLGTQRLVDGTPTGAKWLGVAVFAVAGLYQLSPWKAASIRHCRMHGAEEAGSAGASLVAGVRHGAWCVGCCWALMTVLLAVGVMNVPAMIGLASVIFAEKVWRHGELAARAAGAVLLGLAFVAAVHPSILGGLQPAMGALNAGM